MKNLVVVLFLLAAPLYAGQRKVCDAAGVTAGNCRVASNLMWSFDIVAAEVSAYEANVCTHYNHQANIRCSNGTIVCVLGLVPAHCTRGQADAGTAVDMVASGICTQDQADKQTPIANPEACADFAYRKAMGVIKSIGRTPGSVGAPTEPDVG